MWNNILCILVIPMVAPQTFGERRRNQTCECHKPVFMVHGLISGRTDLLVLEARIKKAHPGTIILNTNAYPDLVSSIPLPRQINGKVGRMFRRFSDKYPCGIIVIGYSQGVLIARALVQSYLNHNVHVLILIAGPVAGVYGQPPFFPQLDPFVQNPVSIAVATTIFYNPAVQRSYSIANFWRDPHRLPEYFERNIFLPYIDNEKPSPLSQTYKAAFVKLKKLVAIGGADDGIVRPYESSFFSFYDENETVVNYRDRDIYTRDLFGLATLDRQGRYIVHNRSGVEHLVWVFDQKVFRDFILPHLESTPSPCRSNTPLLSLK